jgi:hypothetical protein
MRTQPGNNLSLVVIGLAGGLVVFMIGVSVVLAVGQTPPTAMWAAGSAISGALIGLLAPSPAAVDQAGVAAGTATQQTVRAAAESAKDAATKAPQTARGAADEAVRDVDMLSSVAQAKALASSRGLSAEDAARVGATTVMELQRAATTQAQTDLAQEREALDLQKTKGDPTALSNAEARVTRAEAKARVHEAALVETQKSQDVMVDSGKKAAADAVAAAGPNWTLIFLLVFFLLALTLAVILASGAIIPPPAFGDSLLQQLTTAVVALASAAGTAIIGILSPNPGQQNKGT